MKIESEHHLAQVNLMLTKGIKIRPAAHADFDTIEAVHQAAFAKSEFGYSGEGKLARQLHEDGDAIVSLIAEAGGVAVGHVMFSQMQVEADGQCVVAAALAPLGVIPAWQRRGVGALMIQAGLAALKPQGVQLSMVVGHPAYYPRFGYNLALAKPFTCPYSGPYLLALALDENFKIPQAGRAEFAAAFAGF
jgi:putative acetyltransferase